MLGSVMGFRSRPGSRLETQMRLRVMPTGWLIEKEPVTTSMLAQPLALPLLLESASELAWVLAAAE